MKGKNDREFFIMLKSLFQREGQSFNTSIIGMELGGRVVWVSLFCAERAKEKSSERL